MNSIQKNRLKDQLFKVWGIVCTLIGLILLVIFIGDILVDGLQRIDWSFITSLPSRKAEKSGIYTALMGSIWILLLTTIIAFPVGVAAGVYLEEYGKNNRFSALLEINISNLAGVPSIIYGLLGLEVFVRIMNLGASVLAGSLTLSLLILPIIIVATSFTGIGRRYINRSNFSLIKSGWRNRSINCCGCTSLCPVCTIKSAR